MMKILASTLLFESKNIWRALFVIHLCGQKQAYFFVVDVGVQRQEWHVTKLLEKKVRRTRRAVKSANAVNSQQKNAFKIDSLH
jgi:hypothetical protein